MGWAVGPWGNGGGKGQDGVPRLHVAPLASRSMAHYAPPTGMQAFSPERLTLRNGTRSPVGGARVSGTGRSLAPHATQGGHLQTLEVENCPPTWHFLR